MSKYDNYYRRAYSDLEYDDEQAIKGTLMNGEQILWKGKPKASAHVLNSVFAPIFPIVIIWMFVDMTILFGTSLSGDSSMMLFIVPFLLFHMMPVWIWLFQIGKAAAKRKYKVYVVTNNRILIKNENVLFNSIYYTDIGSATVSRSFADKLAGTGDILLDIFNMGKEQIVDITDYAAVYDIIQKKLYEIRTNPAAYGVSPQSGPQTPRQQAPMSMPPQMQQQGYTDTWHSDSPVNDTTQYYVNGVRTGNMSGNGPFTGNTGGNDMRMRNTDRNNPYQKNQ